jgi:glycosyltransferase involved in cell wall biosynthesis
MKLLILTTYYPPEANAASVRMSQIVKRFSYKGKDIEHIRVITFNPLYFDNCKHEKGVNEQDKVEVIRHTRRILPTFVFTPQSLNPLTLIIWIYISLKEIIKYKPDVILTTTPPFAPAIVSGIASRILSKPYIIDYRDDLTSVIDGIAKTKRFYTKYPLKVANKFMSALLFHSLKKALLISTVNEVLQEKLLDLNRNVITVPNGIDIQELNEVKENFDKGKVLEKNGISCSEGSMILAYVGDLNMPYYMPEIILEPLKALLKTGYNVKYIIIGDGKRREQIEKIRKEMGLEDVVFLVGKKEHCEVLELLLACDAAFYSLQENDPQSKHAIGAKVYEYIGCGLPILVLSDEGSAVSELVKTHDIGVFVSWGEIDRMGNALRKLLDSKKYARNIQLHYSYFIKKFDRNRGIDLLYDNVKALIVEFCPIHPTTPEKL